MGTLYIIAIIIVIMAGLYFIIDLNFSDLIREKKSAQDLEKTWKDFQKNREAERRKFLEDNRKKKSVKK